jgi:cholesterol transport system auxiliary component
MQLQSFSLRWRTTASVIIYVALLNACSSPAPRIAVYDFGPGVSVPLLSNTKAPLRPLMLADVEAGSALDGTAVLYRLMYSDAQQLRPYAQARWSMPPSQLLRQRLRELLGQRRSVLTTFDAVAPGTLSLRIEIEEFNQLFDSTQSSSGLVRVRATLSSTGSPPKPVAQTSFVVQRPANSVDARGGVQALAQASDALVVQIDQWLQQVEGAETTSP